MRVQNWESLLHTLVLILIASASSYAQTGVVTWHYDNPRTGANLQETLLTPSNVKSAQFGKLFSHPVDGQIIGQALYLPNLSIPNKGVHNVIFVATMNDTVYAFDADNNTAENAFPLWSTRVLPAGATPVPISVQGGGPTTGWSQVGVVSTPVIDEANAIIYVVAKDDWNGTILNRLYGLDVRTGAYRFTAVPISATFTNSGKTYKFNNLTQVNRPALLLDHSEIYVAFGSNGAAGAEQGWVLAYTASTSASPVPKFRGAFNAEPGKCCGAIWQRGGGLSADPNGHVYAETADGPVVPGINLGQSVLRLVQTTNGLELLDWFTPFDWSYLQTHDLDLDTAVLVLPEQSGTHPFLVIGVGKQGTIYLLDRTDMGHLCAKCTTVDTQIVQELVRATGPETTSLVFWNQTLYSFGQSSPIKAWPLKGGLLSPIPKALSVNLAGAHSAILSANGTTDGIIWQLEGALSSPTLQAFNAVTLKQLYSSAQAGTRDTIPPSPHFVQLMEAQGRVYIGTNSSLVVFGLF